MSIAYVAEVIEHDEYWSKAYQAGHSGQWWLVISLRTTSYDRWLGALYSSAQARRLATPRIAWPSRNSENVRLFPQRAIARATYRNDFLYYDIRAQM